MPCTETHQVIGTSAKQKALDHLDDANNRDSDNETDAHKLDKDRFFQRKMPLTFHTSFIPREVERARTGSNNLDRVEMRPTKLGPIKLLIHR